MPIKSQLASSLASTPPLQRNLRLFGRIMRDGWVALKSKVSVLDRPRSKFSKVANHLTSVLFSIGQKLKVFANCFTPVELAGRLRVGGASTGIVGYFVPDSFCMITWLVDAAGEVFFMDAFRNLVLSELPKEVIF